MIDNLIIAFDAVAPMFLIIALGYGVRQKKMLDGDTIRKVNKVLFTVFFPCLVFWSLYGKSIDEAFDGKLILYVVCIALVLWGITIPFVVSVEKENRTRGAMIQAINRTNFLVVGLPVLNSIYGEGNVPFATSVVVVMLLLSNVMSVTVLEVFRGSRPAPSQILREIVHNPIIAATLLGIVTMIFHIRLPGAAERALSSLNGVGTPMALFVMGASLDLKKIGYRKRNLMICLVGKLVVVPGIVTVTAVPLGFRDAAFAALLVFFAPPPPTTSFTMADQMDSDSELARDCVVFGSALVVFAMFFWLLLWKTLGLF